MTPHLRRTYRRLLAALRDSLAVRRIPLILVAFPSHHAVTHESMREQTVWVARTAAETDVPAVDLLPPLVATGLPTEAIYLLPYDGHPSPRGYAIAAANLADRLASGAVLGPACRGATARSAPQEGTPAAR